MSPVIVTPAATETDIEPARTIPPDRQRRCHPSLFSPVERTQHNEASPPDGASRKTTGETQPAHGTRTQEPSHPGRLGVSFTTHGEGLNMKRKAQPRPVTGPEPLEPVHGSTMCLYSIIENNQAVIYRNQEKIYGLLRQIISNTKPATQRTQHEQNKNNESR